MVNVRSTEAPGAGDATVTLADKGAEEDALVAVVVAVAGVEVAVTAGPDVVAKNHVIATMMTRRIIIIAIQILLDFIGMRLVPS